MKLIVKCESCKSESKAPHFETNRVNYAKEYGENFQMKCKICNQTNEYVVDDIKAVEYTFME
ncbi:MAG: hypothetical protein DRI95_15585 [Bacteroidetes bacterium]|nr:MAG: hypothetical protein DRI95_15585 [Bacteroidota bacterium]